MKLITKEKSSEKRQSQIVQVLELIVSILQVKQMTFRPIRTRETAQQYQQYLNARRQEIQREKQEKINADTRQKAQTNNGSAYRSLHDLMRSPLYRDTAKVLSNNQKKQHIQRHFNNTIDNLPDDALDDFAKKF